MIAAGRDTERCLELLRCYTELGSRGSEVHPLPALGRQGILESLLGNTELGSGSSEQGRVGEEPLPGERVVSVTSVPGIRAAIARRRGGSGTGRRCLLAVCGSGRCTVALRASCDKHPGKH
jgi:hypothetical protein